ncbi:hypothetical protein AAY473_029523 [Plecturocebus cupreus]
MGPLGLNSQTRFHHVDQAGLELPTSGDPPALASKVLGLQTESRSIARLAWQWRDPGSLQLPFSGFRQFSCLSLPISPSPGWRQCAIRLTASVFRFQAILLPQPPE